jgi:hypothetical protein
MEKKSYQIPVIEVADMDMDCALLSLSIEKGEGSGGNVPQSPEMMTMDDNPDVEE